MTPDTRNTWIPWGQWLAVGAMTLEHIARFLLPEAHPLTPWAILLGRTALPLFAAMVAWHAVHNTRDPMAYATRLLVIALVAQVPYSLVIDTGKLNVVFTLALGMLFAVNLQTPGDRHLATAALLLILGVFLGPVIEYGHLGLLLVPAFVLAFRPWPPHWQPILAAPALLIGATLNHALFFNLVSLATVLGLLILLLRFSGHVTASLTAMPRTLWLTWYPLHFTLIAVVHVLLRPPI